MADTDDQLKKLCQKIADELSAGPTVEWCRDNGFALTRKEGLDDEEFDADDLDSYEDRPSGYDWLSNTYDVRFTVARDRSYLGAEVLVAGGGPTVWVDFLAKEVRGTWWSAPVTVPFVDEWEIDEALENEWDAGA